MNRDVKTVLEWAKEQTADGLGAPIRVVEAIDRLTRKRRNQARSLSLPGKTKAERRKDKRERTSEVRKACVERSGGCCERCGASAGEALHMDHFWGRAREESVESCWMLCPRCDRLKTDNHPSRIHWLMEFQQHCARKDYETQAQKVRVHLRLEYAQHPERRSTKP